MKLHKLKKKQKTCIIILNWNGLDSTRACLKSLLELTPQDIKIFLVDNNSRNNESNILREEFGKKARIFSLNKNLGFSGGVNFGINKAKRYKPDFYLLLNNDTKVGKNFLTNLIDTANSHKKIGIVSPIIYDYFDHKKVLFSGGEFKWPLVKFVHKTDIPQAVREEKFITGCSMLIKKEVIEKVGTLDNRFFAYFEDAAYCFVSRKAGFICVCDPKAEIFHIEGASSKKNSLLRTYLISRNRILFVKHYTNFVYQLYFFVFNTIKLLFVVLYFFITRQFERIYAFIKGYIDGYFTEGGIPSI